MTQQVRDEIPEAEDIPLSALRERFRRQARVLDLDVERALAGLPKIVRDRARRGELAAIVRRIELVREPDSALLQRLERIDAALGVESGQPESAGRASARSGAAARSGRAAIAPGGGRKPRIHARRARA
jgi:hypothetical protein